MTEKLIIIINIFIEKEMKVMFDCLGYSLGLVLGIMIGYSIIYLFYKGLKKLNFINK